MPRIEKMIKVTTKSGVLFFDNGEYSTANFASIFPEIRGFENVIEVKFTLEFPAVDGYYFAVKDGQIVAERNK